jgi:FkbM family methyltransferase
MFSGIRDLRDKGYEPDCILDIGAHHGLWTKECQIIFPKATYYLFEAIEYQELTNFKAPNVKVYNKILNNENKMVDWYEMRNTGDSMFRELNKPFEHCVPMKKHSLTLNTVMEYDNLFTDVKNVLIKIDCQGAEIPILQGASNILQKTDFIILELPLFGQYNHGVKTFLEHIQFMDSIGFLPYNFLENHKIYGYSMQVDMMFINKHHVFNDKVKESIKQGKEV